MVAMFHQKTVGFGFVLAIGVCALIPGCCLFKKEKISNPFDGPPPVAAESHPLAGSTSPPAAPASPCPSPTCPVNPPISNGPVTYPAPNAPMSQPAPAAPSGSQPASVSVIVPKNETVPGGSITDTNIAANDSATDPAASLTDLPTDSPTDSQSDGPIRPVGATEGEASISNGSYQTPENASKAGDTENDLLSDPESNNDSGPKSMENSDLPSGFNDYSDSRGAQSPYQNVSRPATDLSAPSAPSASDTPAADTPASDTVKTSGAPDESENAAPDGLATPSTAKSTGDSSRIPTTGAAEIPVTPRPSAEKPGSLGLPLRSNRAQFRVVAE